MNIETQYFDSLPKNVQKKLGTVSGNTRVLVARQPNGRLAGVATLTHEYVAASGQRWLELNLMGTKGKTRESLERRARWIASEELKRKLMISG